MILSIELYRLALSSVSSVGADMALCHQLSLLGEDTSAAVAGFLLRVPLLVG